MRKTDKELGSDCVGERFQLARAKLDIGGEGGRKGIQMECGSSSI